MYVGEWAPATQILGAPLLLGAGASARAPCRALEIILKYFGALEPLTEHLKMCFGSPT